MDWLTITAAVVAGGSLGACIMAAFASNGYDNGKEQGRQIAEAQAARHYDEQQQQLVAAHDANIAELRERHQRTYAALLDSEQTNRLLEARIAFLVACDQASRNYAGRTLQEAVEEVTR